MTLLDASQQAYLKTYRKKLWTRVFTIETVTVPRVWTSPYAGPPEADSVLVASGDWVWADQVQRTPSEGGVIPDADLKLNTDIIYSGSMIHSGARLRVDGTLCAITRWTPYIPSGELEVYAKKIQ